MKKLTALILVLTMSLALAACGCKHEWQAATCDTPKTCELCGKTMGTPRDHSIVDATCEEVRHCEYCDATLGLEPLGHNWSEATTEEPMTCMRCGTTEGERIITDPRFTTAATRDLQGKWIMQMPIDGEMLGISDFPEGATMDIVFTFGNAGDLSAEVSISDSFTDLLMQYTMDRVYSEFEAMGMGKDAADAMVESTYGLTIQDYVAQEIANADYAQMLTETFNTAIISGVYYVEKGLLYTGESWDAEMTREGYLQEYNTLMIESITEEFGEECVLTRATD